MLPTEKREGIALEYRPGFYWWSILDTILDGERRIRLEFLFLPLGDAGPLFLIVGQC